MRAKIGPPYFPVKSENPDDSVDFDDLIARLRDYIGGRINRGEFTERSLARALRVSQPHLHNMLKGIRQISVAFANRVMFKFGISVLDLVADEEIWNYLDRKNPDWLMAAARRKPPGKVASSLRDQSRRLG